MTDIILQSDDGSSPIILGVPDEPSIVLGPSATPTIVLDGGARGATGADGQDGADGAPGVGVPTGGTTNQVLAKASDTDYDTTWVAQSGGGGGATNLTATLSATDTIINSDTGTDATIPAVDATNAGVMTPTQKTKLDGIATNATANDTDANLKNRANHTGTQLASTISDFSAAADARITNFVGAAPGALDTLDELAAALGDDANFSTTVTNSLAGKQPLDSDLTTIAGLTATTDNFIQSKAGAWASRTVAQVKTDLGLTGTNSGDQTTIVGITGTKSQFNTAVTDGDITYLDSADIITGAKTFNAGTLLDKGSHVFNVKAYGAVGNGTTDDTTAIQAAITAAQAAGGRVYFPSGTFMTNALTITASNVHIQGAGFGATTIKLRNTQNTTIFTVSGTGTVNVAFTDLTIDGNKANNTTSGNGISFNTPYSATDTQHLIQNVDVVNVSQNGIIIAGDTRVVRIISTRVKAAGYDGYSLAGSDHQVTNAIADFCGANGFAVYGSNITFVGSKAFWCDTLVAGHCGFMVAAQRSFFIGCEAQDNYQIGFYFTSAHNSTLIGCVGDSNGQGASGSGIGIAVDNTNKLSITGGAMIDRAWTTNKQAYGIRFTGTSTGSVTTGVIYDGNVTGTYSDASSGTNTHITSSGGGGATNLSQTLTATTVAINSDTGTDVTIAAADTTNAGVMTKAMFDKLSGVATGATAYNDAMADARVAAAAATGTGSLVRATSPTITTPTVNTSASMTAAAGTERGFFFKTGASDRWKIVASSDAEGGANAGSNYAVNSYTDAGAYLGTPLFITRSSGAIALNGATTGASSILVNNNAGIGYTTGAGGTVTQATSKATGVTLSKVTGTITLNAASLAANTTVSFTVTNTACAATDNIILSHVATGAFGSYLLNAVPAAGSFSLNVRNVTAAALAEAIQVRFTIIKSVNA